MATRCPPVARFSSALVMPTTVWKMSRFATRWLYLIALRCSSRSAAVVRPLLPNETHWVRPATGGGLGPCHALGVYGGDEPLPGRLCRDRARRHPRRDGSRPSPWHGAKDLVVPGCLTL